MPAYIFRPSDKIVLKFPEGLTVTVSPLSQEARGKLRELYKTIGGEDKSNAPLVARETLRMTVKAVDGLCFGDGTPFELKFGPDGMLTEECAEELTMVSFFGAELVIACTHVGVGAYQNLIGPGKQDSLSMVDVVFATPAEKKTPPTSSPSSLES